MKKVYLNTLSPEEIIARLKHGEVVYTEGNKEYTTKFIDGFLCTFENGKLEFFNDTLCNVSNKKLYFEEEEKFEVDGVGLYRTRDGRKAFVSMILTGECLFPVCGIIEGKGFIDCWTKEGTLTEEGVTESDLVGRWEE